MESKRRVAIVTGGASGIGKASAFALARGGAAVIIADINAVAAEQAAEEIRALNVECLALTTDVSEPSQLKEMVDRALSHFGRIDVLVNNAADLSLLAFDKDLLETDVHIWERTYRANQQSVMVASKEVLPHMIRQGSGAIINVSSVDGALGETTRFAYGMAKAAINLLTKSIATTYGPMGVRCNAILPGLVMTPLAKANIGPAQRKVWERNIRSTRLGVPDDIGSVVEFLASDASFYINGQSICVDGGLLSHVPHLGQFEEMELPH